MRRRLRKHPQHHPIPGEREHVSSRRRVPYGLIWLVVAVLILVIVIVYDRRSINEAEAHIANGQELEQKGLYVEALEEYDRALANRRLGRKAKGGVALSMADIYYEHLDDFPAANRYYVQARQISPAVFKDQSVQERPKDAATRSKGTGVFSPKTVSDSGRTTHTIIQRVDLLQKPQADQRGPVVAAYEGGEIRAGQLLRALEKRPEFLRPDFREDPAKLKAFLDGILREDLAYEAAVRSGIHKDPDVSERLFDYQKQLITQRYLVDRRQQAMVVDNKAVEDYYREHVDEYVQPGRITVSMIKSDSETSAAELLQMLRGGERFRDVATSYSTEKQSAVRGGDAGTLTEKDTNIPGIGKVPQVVEGLFKLPVHSVSEVTPIGDNYYIFRVTGVTPALNITLEEARGRIENILRGRSVDEERLGMEKQLNEAFNPQINDDNLARFWDFAQRESGIAARTSSGAAETTSAHSEAYTATQPIINDAGTTEVR